MIKLENNICCMIYNYFIRTFLSILIFFISLISYSTAEIINKFEIDGNERIPNETIIMFSGKILETI